MINELKPLSDLQLHDVTRQQNLVMLFPKNRSPSYPAMVMLAKQATSYGETEIDGTLYHFSGFDMSSGQVQIALSMLQYLSGIKGMQVYAKGKLCSDTNKVYQVLNCSLEASACDDSRAHCHVVKRQDEIFQGEPVKTQGFGISMSISELFGDAKSQEAAPPLYIFPCRFLLLYGFKIQRHHPSTEQNQIQAGAIQRGCDYCPHFNQNDLKQIR
jgi:hypothetical protein